MLNIIVPYRDQIHDKLVEIWHRAVVRTHTFLTDEDIQFYRQVVGNGALREVEVWVALNERLEPTGFIGLNGSKIEALFVDPDSHGRGIGRRLIQHAEALNAGRPLQVDVNEQNEGARVFYERLGFARTGRSELDGSGRPFPLLHLERLPSLNNENRSHDKMKRTVITNPADPAQLNLEYLTACLNRAGRLVGNARPTGYRLEPLHADNSSGYRIRLVYENGNDGSGSPGSLFLKLCSGTFGRSEVDYYTKDYLGLTGAPTPFCYDAYFEHSSYHLLLEDLTDTHRNNWSTEPSLAYAQAAARAMAKLHGHHWGADRLRTSGEDATVGTQLERYLTYMRLGFNPLLEALQEEEDTSRIEIASDIFEWHPDAMTERLSTGGPFTLIHGDLNPGNILSRRDGRTEDLFFIDRQPFDWSLQNWVGPSDLSYMMVLWWEPEQRRTFELDVLRTYHESLVEFGITDYSWEMILSDYRLSAFQCFYVAASWCIDPEERTNMRWLWSAQLDRACAFYRDWHGREAQPSHE